MAAAAQASFFDRALGAVRGFGRAHHAPEPSAAAPAEAPKSNVLKLPVRRTAIAGSGTLISAGAIQDLDPNRELRGPLWYGSPGRLGISQRMTKDGSVRRSLGYIVDPIRAGLWYMRPGSDKDKRSVECARLAQCGFIDSQNWDEVLQHGLGGACRDGVAMAEMTDDVIKIDRAEYPLHPGGGYAVMPTGFHQIQPSTIRRFNPRKGAPTQLESIQQYIQGGDAETAGTIDVPSDRLIRWTVEQEGSNFPGFALLRSAYGAFKLKIAFLTIRAIRLEKQGVGIPMVTLPEDANEADVEAAESILAEMRAHEKGYAIWAHDFKFEWSTPGGSMGNELEAAIGYCDAAIANNVDAAFMYLGQKAHGSFALAQTQQGQYQISLEGWARFFAVPFNRGVDGWSPLKRFTLLNYGEDVAPPVLCVRNLPVRDWSKVFPLLPNMVNAGLLTPDDPLEDMLRESMTLPRRHPESARKKPEKMILDDGAAAPKPADYVEPTDPEDDEETDADEEDATDE